MDRRIIKIEFYGSKYLGERRYNNIQISLHFWLKKQLKTGFYRLKRSRNWFTILFSDLTTKSKENRILTLLSSISLKEVEKNNQISDIKVIFPASLNGTAKHVSNIFRPKITKENFIKIEVVIVMSSPC